MLLGVALALACSGASANEFNRAISQGIRSELELELPRATILGDIDMCRGPRS